MSYKNEGKIFEECWKKSVPKDVFILRLKDQAASFSTVQTGLKFVTDNPCDFIMFNPATKTMYALELKSTGQTNLTFWREDFVEEKDKKFMIKKNQIKGLEDIAHFPIISGFVINFRFTNHTYFISITDFLNFSRDTNKKSINEADVIKHNGVLIEQSLMKKNYKYDVEKFLKEVKID